jgi:glyoxylase-like metal-dependent hydrolase (beta-lactamase superfamily II)
VHTARLSDSVLVVTGDYAEEHLTVIATGDGLVVVDTLATLPATRATLPLIRAFSDEPVRVVVNTHLDADHVAGNQAFTGAAILAHANGTAHLGERIFDDPASEHDIRDFTDQLRSSEVPADPILAARRQAYIEWYTHLLEGFGDFVAAPPFVFVSAETRVVLGTVTVELHHFGRAHSDADLVVVVPGEDLILTGDVALGRAFAPAAHAEHGGSLVGLAQALDRIEGLASTTTRVVPGHGAVGDCGLLRDQRTYVEELLAAVRDAQGRGLTLDAARPTLELAAFSRRLLYDLVHPAHVQLAWDEMAAHAAS